MARERLWLEVCIASLSLFNFGYNTASIGGALLYIDSQTGACIPEDLCVRSDFEKGLIVSVILLGAMFGALGAGFFVERFGSRSVVLANNVLYIFGPLGMGLAPTVLILVIWRGVAGIAVGVSSAVVSLYVSEIVPAERRGEYGGVAALFVPVGILASLIASAALGEHWRILLASAAVPAILQLLFGFYVLPESPVWQARRAALDEPLVGDATSQGAWSQLWSKLLSGEARRPLLVAVTLQILQQITGINVTVYYGPKIFASVFSPKTSIMLSAGVTLASMSAGLVMSKVIDRVGRLPMAYVGVTGMGTSLVAIAASFMFPKSDLTGCASCVAILAYRVFFGMSLGPLPYIVTAEIFPSTYKAAGASVCWSFNWISNFLTSFTFLPLVDHLTEAGAFVVYSVICIFALLFLCTSMPETSDKENRSVKSTS